MKILSINITEFGGLSDFKLELDGALNIIEGGNESGKSTILLFIIYMLYGLPKTAKKNTPGAFDKVRSLSWANSRAEGSMEIEQDGIRYRIERANVRRTASSEAQITDIDTGARVHVGKEPGEVFLGVSRETFESCLWCGQSRASAISGEKLTETLSNLSLTADESVNGDAVLSAIRNARKQYRHERGEGGSIYELSRKISEKTLEANRVMAELKQNAADIERYDELKNIKQAADEALWRAKAERDAVRTLNLLSRFKALREYKESIERDRRALELLEKEGVGGHSPDVEELAALRQLERDYARAKQGYDACLHVTPIASKIDMSAADVAEKISARESKETFIERISDELSKIRKKGIAGAVCLAGSVVSAVIFKVIATALSDSLLLLGLLLCISAAVAVLGGAMLALAQKEMKAVRSELVGIGCNADNYENRVGYCFDELEKVKTERVNIQERERRVRNAKESLESVEKDIDEILIQYGRAREERGESIARLISDVRGYLDKKNEISGRISVNGRIAENDGRQLEKYDEAELAASLPEGLRVDTSIDENSAERRCREAELNCRKLDEELRELEVKIRSSGVSADTQADIEGEIAALGEILAEHTERYDILDMAYSAVEEAYGNMRRSFAPSVRDGAGRLLECISGGKYSKIFLSEEFGVGVEVTGKERSAACLSSGTSDAVYIALRLSLIENIFEGSVPFFMDETLSSLDDTRAMGVLELISEYVARGNQCMLMTCHGREAKLCDEIGLCYRKTEISH